MSKGRTTFRRCWALIVAPLCLTTTVSVRAQRDIDPRDAVHSTNDVTRPYQPPGARKSVEIGNFYLRRKKYKAALSRFEEAVQTDPDYAPAYLGLGKTYEKLGLKQKALDSYKQYLDLLPSAKQAEEAKDAHHAIDRLERELGHRNSPPAS
jgi:tetratricopeptide (TPR) repeat protein